MNDILQKGLIFVSEINPFSLVTVILCSASSNKLKNEHDQSYDKQYMN